VSPVAWAAVGLVGGIGAVARSLIAGAIQARAGARFPLGTLAVNVSGTFALGLLAGAAPGDGASLLAGTALLGAYTTFSTWMLETWQLANERRRLAAALYVAVSLASGLAAAALGRALL
jgi:fluoride exporter